MIGMTASVVRDVAVCPRCRCALEWSRTECRCTSAGCGATYPVKDGIPVLLVNPEASDHDELDHAHGHKHKQAHYFDRNVANEFEITRPNASPALYQWMLAEKFRRSISGIAHLLPGATVLTVCGGSGMDGQFLAAAGAHVVVGDISLEAAKRAQTRAQRFALDMEAAVADVEQLPFPDRAFDVVYVHDGLHHLEDPAIGLREMARVARTAITVTEPADAAVTRAAVRLGLALAEEEAGNKVARLRPDDVADTLRLCGFATVQAQRYAMFYRHEPGLFMRLGSNSAVFGGAVKAWRLANMVLGPVGNKLAVVAVRAHQDSGNSSATDAVEPSTTL